MVMLIALYIFRSQLTVAEKLILLTGTKYYPCLHCSSRSN
ncbi:hypothetical protein Gohar_016408 [Gossypium harknessii]|uniref:Uncharacterized protein n=1 Tax=Gossypium harknessii TaxID=34285 RepID=A0A7J9G2T9_9ROSI|nr:hypothetical protein [Gossypium harknessii]